MKERVRWRHPSIVQRFKKRVPYSFVRIDVQDGRPPKFIIRPFVAEQVQREWYNHHLKTFAIGRR